MRGGGGMDKDFLELKRPDIKTAWQTKKIFWKKML